jgi:hypothetical protein
VEGREKTQHTGTSAPTMVITAAGAPSLLLSCTFSRYFLCTPPFRRFSWFFSPFLLLLVCSCSCVSSLFMSYCPRSHDCLLDLTLWDLVPSHMLFYILFGEWIWSNSWFVLYHSFLGMFGCFSYMFQYSLGIYAPCDDLHSGFGTRIIYMFDSLISAHN